MRRVCLSSDPALLKQGVHDDLNALARNRASAGELWHGLRTEAVKTSQNAAASSGLRTVAMQIGGKRAQTVRQGTNLIKEPNGCASAILHDNHIVIMTMALSNDQRR